MLCTIAYSCSLTEVRDTGRHLLVNSSIVSVQENAMTLCVWDPGIHFNSMALTGYKDIVNMDPLQLLGKFCFIGYTNSVNQVWDLGQQRCMHSSVLLFVPVLAVVISLNFSFWDTFAKWVVVVEMTDSVNRVFTDRSLREASREIQPIAPLGIIHLPKSVRFLQRLLAQLRGGDCSFRKKRSERASALKLEPKGKEVTPIFFIARLQGCIKSTTKLIEQELHNFSMFEEIMVFFGAQGVPASYVTGDKIIDCPSTFSLYEFAALQACESDHCSWTMIKSELELVKDASIVDAYVVHKSVIDESKNTSALISWGNFKATARLMCRLTHFGGHRFVDEFTVAQQIQFAELGKTFGAAIGPSLLATSRAFLAIILEQNHQSFSLLCGTPREVNKRCRLRDPGSSSYLKQSYCYEIAVDRVWFQLRTTLPALYTHSSHGRYNNILFVWLYSNLEDKVLIEGESIVMNQVQPNMNTKATQLVIGLKRAIGPRTSNRARLIWIRVKSEGRVIKRDSGQ